MTSTPAPPVSLPTDSSWLGGSWIDAADRDTLDVVDRPTESVVVAR